MTRAIVLFHCAVVVSASVSLCVCVCSKFFFFATTVLLPFLSSPRVAPKTGALSFWRGLVSGRLGFLPGSRSL